MRRSGVRIPVAPQNVKGPAERRGPIPCIRAGPASLSSKRNVAGASRSSMEISIDVMHLCLMLPPVPTRRQDSLQLASGRTTLTSRNARPMGGNGPRTGNPNEQTRGALTRVITRLADIPGHSGVGANLDQACVYAIIVALDESKYENSSYDSLDNPECNKATKVTITNRWSFADDHTRQRMDMDRWRDTSEDVTPP